MTGINNPFSQFNIPYAPIRNQNNIAPNEQIVQPDKKRFISRDLFIPAGTTAACGIGGFAVAKYQARGSFEILKQNALTLEKKLTEQLNKSRDIIQLNKNIAEAKKGFDTAEINLAEYQKELLETQKQSQIDIINDLIKSAEEMKSSNAIELEKHKTLLNSYQEQYIRTPVDSFVKSETAKIKSNKNNTIAIYTAIGLIVGLGITIINKYLKREDK